MADDDEDYEGEEEAQPVTTWSGESVDFIPNGQGVAEYSNSDSYQGWLEMGKKQGHAVYKFAIGAQFEGEYMQDLREGWGSMTYPDSGKYEGYWSSNKRNGQGTYTYPNGDIYKGEWKDDLKHGTGTYNFKSSMSQFVGTWENGSFKEGEWILRDGNSYEGNFNVNSKPEGPGKFKFFSLNNTLHGRYDDGKWVAGSLESN